MQIRGRTAALLVLPAVLLYGVFLLYPTVRGLLLSFTNSTTVTGGSFIGLANYTQLLHDPAVIAALKNTIVYAIVVVIVQNAIAIAVASQLHHRLPGLRGVVRSGLLIPAMMPAVTVAYVWTFIYSPVGGPLDAILNALGLRRLELVWLGNTKSALLAVAAANIWTYVGYSAAIYLAGYAAIPPSIHEAASLDGATGWRRFWRIDWPLLAPALTVNVILSTIGSLRVFELPLVMTGGGPDNATQTFSFLIYQQGFGNFRFGYGTALAVVLLVITAVVSIGLSTLLRRREVAL